MKLNVAGYTGSARVALAGSVAVLALAVPAVAQAQTAPREEAQPATEAPAVTELTGNEIVVTATKREQTLQDVPVAVTVTSAQTIERAQIRDIRDLSTVVPSLRVNTLQSSANTNFYIRGFGNGANNAGIEPSVGLFVDGVYRSRSASMITDLPDVQRIEVLRGPQSTLFGKNASAGVISLVTKEPQFKLGGNMEASYGNYNAIIAKGYITGPLGENVAASLAAGYNKRDGYVTDLGSNTKANERNRWFTRGQLLFEPSSDFKVRLIGDYSRIDENCCAVVNVQRSPGFGPSQIITNLLGGKISDPANPFADVTYSNIPSTNKIDNWGFSGQMDYGVGPLKLTSITAYRKTKAITNQDSDFTSADLIGRNFQNLRIDTFTQEFRASTDWDGPINGLLGAFYFNETINQNNQLLLGNDFRNYADFLIRGQSGGAFTLPQVEQLLTAATGGANNYIGQSFVSGRGFTEQYRLKNEAFSIFGQVDFKVSDRLTLTGGLNYTHDSKSYSTNNVSNEVFSAIPLSSPTLLAGAAQVLTAQTFNQRTGLAPTPANIGAFAAANPAVYQAIVAGSTAAANQLPSLAALQFLPPFLNVPNALETGRVKDGQWSVTARLAYDVNDHLNVYAAYATGYKAASINLSRDSRPSPADLATIQTNPAYTALRLNNLGSGSRFADPEISTVYEAGLKGNWGVASANLAVFKQSIKGFQSNIFAGTGFRLANAGKQSTFGIEFEGTARPLKELTLSLGLTYLDPKFDSFLLSGVGDLTGTRPAGISPLTASFGVQWDQELGNGDHLILHGDYRYEAPFALVEGLPNLVQRNSSGAIISNTAAVLAAQSRKQEIKLLNASLTYAMANGLEFTVWGRNIGNQRTILQIFDSPVQIGSISGYPSEPRTWGGAVRYRF
ncbi:TonB-dependent receptor [Novosphingobium aerophilum]|uniref:TonB-dependent receptor n=1 Tax=Novosphingobium aerophilum TaxID=2839843 RepID=A0A7X1F9V4_9SPHN|nr:TonB-dependent receptor [Novosphingobium aerophilum]MBC2653082.1 TonB-dependent receptor [Novosphingobium aerophilum]